LLILPGVAIDEVVHVHEVAVGNSFEQGIGQC
jgi:hypothetical protein